MFGWFNKKPLVDKMAESALDNSVLKDESVAAKPKTKPRKPRQKKVVEKKEPKVDILKFDFDPKDPKLGSIELDWNDEFIILLTEHGYSGASEEEIVDKWLNDVCRNIVLDQYQGAPLNTTPIKSAATMVNKKPLGGGKTEVS